MGIEETAKQLREAVTDARRRHASASEQAALADARAAAVREDLTAEFGVSTVHEAREKQAELERQLEGEAAEVQRLLELAGGHA